MTTTPDASANWDRRPLRAISETSLRVRGAEVLKHLVRLGVDASPGNRVAKSVGILDKVSRAELVPSVDNIGVNQLILAAMRAIYEAVIIVDARLRDSPQSHLFTDDRLRMLVEGALQSGASDAAANRRFETFFAALLVKGGFSVHSGEPDWRIQYFDETLGIAVKRLNASTTDAAQNLIRDGARQIKKQSLRGIVVLNVERLVDELPAGLDAAEYGMLFNEKLRGLHEQFTHLLHDGAPMNRLCRAMLLLLCGGAAVSAGYAQPQPATSVRSGNPVLPGWYADPEAHVFGGQYWIFPTYSAPYNAQTFMDAFSSRDLFFGANDIQSDKELGGIGVARARSPGGPFVDYLDKPLIDKFYNGAQPIDQMVFRDTDGAYYIVYGGWRHCNIARLNDTFTGFIPFPDGSTFKEIMPPGYVEGAYMFMNNGKYYFMWSEGGWTVSIDEMRFDERGFIQPVVLTTSGVRRDALPAQSGGAPLTAAAVRAARARSNAAIAARDTAALAALASSSYHSVSSRNVHTSGRASVGAQYAGQFSAHPDVRYVRTPHEVHVYAPWQMADERGTWVGTWTEPDGRVTIRGRYSAKWRRTDGVWLLEAEVFTPLSCRGSSYCTRPPAQP